MKLRFRENSLRLRVNRREVEALASGAALAQRVHFPGNASIRYVLEPSDQSEPEASFTGCTIRVAAPRDLIRKWAGGETVGIYFELPANGTALKVAIEKDLECLEARPEEQDVEAFPRARLC